VIGHTHSKRGEQEIILFPTTKCHGNVATKDIAGRNKWMQQQQKWVRNEFFGSVTPPDPYRQNKK
jgi:hypothetical protein